MLVIRKDLCLEHENNVRILNVKKIRAFRCEPQRTKNVSFPQIILFLLYVCRYIMYFLFFLRCHIIKTILLGPQENRGSIFIQRGRIQYHNISALLKLGFIIPYSIH